MKTIKLFAYKFTQAEVDAGNADSLPNGSIVWIVDNNGVPTGKVYTASGSGVVEGGSGSSFREWQAKTAYSQGQIAVAPSTQGTISAGDLIVRTTQGTSGTTFSATEASKWTEVADDPDLVKKADIVNNLTDTSTDKPLSAAQGKALQDGKSATTHNHDAAYEAKNANIQTHISSTSNPHGVTKSQLGLGSVDNTADAAKPMSDTVSRVFTPSHSATKAVAHPTNFSAYTATTSEGTSTVSASSEYAAVPSFQAYKAFDGNSATDWATNGVTANYWIAVQLPFKKLITRVAMVGRGSNENPATWRIEGSDDGTTWDILYSSSTAITSSVQTFDFDNKRAYLHYRMFALTSTSGALNSGLSLLEFSESLYGHSNATTTAAGFMSGADKTKLDGIAAGANVNVQADWNQTTTTADDYIKNKPTLSKVDFFSFADSGAFSTTSTSFVDFSTNMNVSLASCAIGDKLDISAFISRIQHNTVDTPTHFQLVVTHPDTTISTVDLGAVGNSNGWAFRQFNARAGFSCTQAGTYNVKLQWKTSAGTAGIFDDNNGSGLRKLNVIRIR